MTKDFERQRRNAAAALVRQQTLGIVELLKNIIVHLPAETILTRALRVSKTWNNAINASPAIQKKLWRRPQAANAASPSGVSGNQDLSYLELLQPFKYTALSSGVPTYSGKYHINSLFPDAPGQRYRHDLWCLPREPVTVDLLSDGRYLVQVVMLRDQPSPARSETPSWFSVQLTEPPITTAWIEVFPQTHGFVTDYIQATLRDSGGVMFGMVRDAADKMLATPAYSHIVRDKKPATIGVCFVVDGAEVWLSPPP